MRQVSQNRSAYEPATSPPLFITRKSLNVASPQNRRGLRKIIFLSALLVAAHILTSSVSSQELDGPAWPGHPPELFDLFVGWDYFGMTEDEVSAHLGISHPLTNAEIEAKLSPQEKIARDNAMQSLANPSTTPPVLSDAAVMAAFVITHPIEYEQWSRKQKTSDQLESEAISMWMILHPAEAFAIAQTLKTPEEIAAQIKAQIEALDPQLKPKPIIKQVPPPDAVSGTVATPGTQP